MKKYITHSSDIESEQRTNHGQVNQNSLMLKLGKMSRGISSGLKFYFIKFIIYETCYHKATTVANEPCDSAFYPETMAQPL